MRLFSWQAADGGSLWHLPGIYTREKGLDPHWLSHFYWWSALLTTSFVTANIMVYLLMGYFTLPFTYVNGVNIGMQSKAAGFETLSNELVQQPVRIAIGSSSYSRTLEQLGVTINERRTNQDIRNVNGIASLPLFKLVTNPMMNTLPTYSIDRQKMEAELAEIIEPSMIEPTSAALVIPYLEADPITITPSEVGSEFSVEIAADQLITAIRSGTTLPESYNASPRTIAPAIHESELELLMPALNDRLSTPVTIQDVDGKDVTTVSTLTMRNMIELAADEAEVRFNQELLQDYLREELALYFFEAPTPKRIKNGTTQNEGKNGLELDLEAAYNVFTTQVATGATTIQLATRTSPFATVTDGQYEKTSAGLQALIRDFDIEKRGDYRIIVHQLRGGDIRATHQGATSSIPASTYKTFIAYAAMKAAEQGELSLQDKTRYGTIEDCFFEMLHYSTDFCAFAIQDFMTWPGVDQKIREANIENTWIGNEDRVRDKYTTAQDEYKLYKGLYDGTLLNEAHTEQLLNYLKNQKWRSGIPGGSSPSVVADKVGFYAGWINDVGIVYGDNADYIIVALSDGGSFWEINDLSRRVYNFFEN